MSNQAETQKQRPNVIEEITLNDPIPLCLRCLMEFKPGEYICHQCKVNLCRYHYDDHSSTNPSHSYAHLNTKQ